MKFFDIFCAGWIILLSCEPRQNNVPDHDTLQRWINPIDQMPFVWIKPGVINLTEAIGIGDSITVNERQIFIDSGFWMGMTEITVGQFREFVKKTGYMTSAEKEGNRYHWKNPGFLQTENNPVVYTSFEDAQAYSDWAGAELPTEAEWLYACRADMGSRYFWGDTLDERYLWYRRNSPKGTHQVALKLPNPWGLYDMVGNAWEYVRICDHEYGIRGSSWTRCNSYVTRNGSMAEHLIGASIETKLSECKPFYAGAWDDDRGFRCIKRSRE